MVALALMAFALVAALRLPGAWVEGRFQDEELSVFFAYAWHFPPIDALLRPFGGYWNILANGFTLLAAQAVKADLVPLAKAPYLTMVAGLVFQLIPPLLLLTGKAAWLPNKKSRFFAIVLLALLPGTEEVYLNVMHIQFHLAFAVALILALEVPERRLVQLLYWLILLLAPFCGPGAILLLPLLALRALLERSGARGWQVAVLSAGAAIQLLLFYSPSAVRGTTLDLLNVPAAMFVRMLVFPLFGGGMADRIALAVEGSMQGSRLLLIAMSAVTVSIFGAFLLRLAVRRDGSVWLLLGSLSVAFATLAAGLATTNPAAPFFISAGLRYNYLPLGLLFLSIMTVALGTNGREQRGFRSLLLLLLLVGMIEYSRPMSALAHGPSWPAEVAAWERNPHHPLAVWPVPYKANLSGKPYDCGPPGARWGSATAPRYCESGWMYQSFGLPEQPR